MNSVFIRAIVAVAAAVGAFGGTTSVAEDSPGRPDYISRARSGTQGEVRVSASALSAEESAAVYGAPLADKLIQPVWIEIENKEAVPYWLMHTGLDPDFIPASEAAEAMVLKDPNRKLKELDRRFSELAFRNPVPPGATVSGFVLTNLHEGAKLLQIDLFADRRSHSFSFLATVPGLRTDYQRSRVFDPEHVAKQNGVVNFTNDAEFAAALEALPVLRDQQGRLAQWRPAEPGHHRRSRGRFRFAGPPRLEPNGDDLEGIDDADDELRHVRERYPYAPISNLYLFGRPQDIGCKRRATTSTSEITCAYGEARCFTTANPCGWDRSVATSAAG